jgi:hypothetical protein
VPCMRSSALALFALSVIIHHIDSSLASNGFALAPSLLIGSHVAGESGWGAAAAEANDAVSSEWAPC